MKRPYNHVTSTMDLVRALQSTGKEQRPPEIPTDLVEWMEAQYPPRTYDHRRESLEDHIEYGGFVKLTALFRHHHDAQQAPDAEGPEEE